MKLGMKLENGIRSMRKLGIENVKQGAIHTFAQFNKWGLGKEININNLQNRALHII